MHKLKETLEFTLEVQLDVLFNAIKTWHNRIESKGKPKSISERVIETNILKQVREYFSTKGKLNFISLEELPLSQNTSANLFSILYQWDAIQVLWKSDKKSKFIQE